MLDLKTEVVAALNNILPTWYEDYTNSDMVIPCITYSEYMNNQDRVCGTKIFFSTIGFKIKIWGRLNATEDPVVYQNQVDTAMRSLGYYRESSNELTVGNQVCKIMNYITYCEEHIN